MNKGAGLAVVAAVAVAAMRLSSGIASPAPQLHSEAAIHRTLPKKNTTSKPSLPGYVDGCDAYLPDPADKAGTPHTVAYPEQDEFGAAKSVVDNFFGPDFDKAFDKAAKTQPASLSNIQYAIALAPDPRHTNLSVMFDRQMVAIQQAAQDENYAYNSSWLPWALESQSYPLLGDQQLSSDLADRREACPGILLFRRSTDANGAPNSSGTMRFTGSRPTPRPPAISASSAPPSVDRSSPSTAI